MDNVRFAIWFFLPAGAANVTPIPLAKMPWFRDRIAPVDAGLTLRGKRLFGDNKTWRGILIGVLAAIAAASLQLLFYHLFPWIRTISMQVDYENIPVVLLGFTLGFGALGGDLLESFVK